MGPAEPRERRGFRILPARSRRSRSSSSGFAMLPSRQQFPGDLGPFGLDAARGNRAARASVPIAGVGQVAFLAVKIGMHPRPIGAPVRLGGLVRGGPIAAAVMPKPKKGPGKAPGRLSPCRFPEFVD